MTWFFIAIIGPFLYALTNHIDKFLLERYFKTSGAGTLILFSSLLSVIALPIFYLLDSTIFDVSVQNIAVLVIVGLLNIMVLWCYLIALQYEEASVAIVFYQLVPVFGYVLGYFVLGEALTHLQLTAMALVILGTTIIAFEIDSENHFKLRSKTILPMVAASFFWATGSVIFKEVALEENVLRSLFWEHLTLVLVGIIIFMFVKSYRNSFLEAIRNNSKEILSVNVLNEVLFICGNLAFSFAFMLAPVALVLLTDSFQPVFVLIIGVFLTIFFPKIAVEKIQVKHLVQKSLAVCVTGIGAYLLAVS